MNVNVNLLDELCSVEQIKIYLLKDVHMILIIKQDVSR